ncbi:hypothetical protein U1Q18_051511, partial [Sarracenia purpurea var. burkii]
MLDLVSSRKSCYVQSPWKPPIGVSKTAPNSEIEKLIEHKAQSRKKSLTQGKSRRPYSYHGTRLQQQTQMNAYQTLVHEKPTSPPGVEFGAGGGFADISRTWRFHPFKT